MTFDPVAVGEELAERSRANQGLPLEVEEPALVAKLARLLSHGTPTAPAGRPALRRAGRASGPTAKAAR